MKSGSPMRWRSSTVRYIIRNQVYTGTYTIKSRLEKVTCHVTPIVSEDVWTQANEQLTRNKNKPKGNQKRLYLLSGLITCGLCGAKYVGARTSDGKGWFRYYYRCGRQLHAYHGDAPQCSATTVRADALEEHVWNQCVEFVKNPGEVIFLLQKRLAEYVENTKDTTEKQSLLQQSLMQKGQARERIKHLFIQGHITPDEMEENYKTVDREISALRRELDELRSQVAITSTYSKYYESITVLLETLRQSIATADATLKQYVISRLLSGIRVNTKISDKSRKHAQIECHFHFKTDHVALNGTTRH